MLLPATGGDVTHARKTATQVVAACGARTYLDLLPIAQVIAFGLAALDSLNRSMNEAMPTAAVIRLRANAANLNRAAEQCRRALRISADAQQLCHEARYLPATASPLQMTAETPAARPSPNVLRTAATQPAIRTPTPEPAASQPAAAKSPATQSTTTQSTTTQSTTTPPLTVPFQLPFNRKA